MGSRIKWIDIAKGIGIIAVVLGHSRNPFLSHYIYWFHMPLFFVISGYLHKQPDSIGQFLESTRRKIARLFVPYVSFYFLILTILKIESNQALAINLNDLSRLIWGGQRMGSGLAPFWFITVLFLTQISFSLLRLKIKNNKAFFAAIALAYVLSYFDSLLSQSGHDIQFFWNADVVLLAIVFYSVGYLLKSERIAIQWKMVTLCSLITCSAIVFDWLGIIDYSLNMRTSRYDHFLLDILIPVAMCILIIHLSGYLERFSISKYLAQAGKDSLTIMYLNLTINIISDNFVPRHFLFVTILGVIIPILISKFVFEKYSLTRFLFLGELPRKKPIGFSA